MPAPSVRVAHSVPPCPDPAHAEAAIAQMVGRTNPIAASARMADAPNGERTRDPALRTALSRMPCTALARRLGISYQALSQWDRVPPARVLEVERLTGVSRSELRPDFYPSCDRGTDAESVDLEVALHAVLRAHREADEAYTLAATAADRVAIRRAGGDLSEAALAALDGARDAASVRCVSTWAAVLSVRPRSPSGLLALLRHLREVDAPVDVELADVLEQVEGILRSLSLPAAVPSPHLDGGLLDLWRRRQDAHRVERAASLHLDAIRDAVRYPPPGEAAHLRAGDEALGLARYAEPNPDGQPRYPFERADARVRTWRRWHFRAIERPVRPEDNLPASASTVVQRVDWPEAQARADEIAAAWDARQAACREIYADSGLEAANAAWEAADDALAALDGAIAAAPARTLEGLAIKAQLAQGDLDLGEDPHPPLIEGLMRDILALTGAPA